MISYIIIITTILAFIIMLVATRSKMYAYNSPDANTRATKEFNPGWLSKPILLLVIGLVISWYQPFKLDRVEQGNIGILVKLSGNERGVSDYTYTAGWTLINTWNEQLFQYPSNQQHVEYGVVEVSAKGGFVVEIEPMLNYSLVADKVGDMFKQFRVTIPQLEKGYLKTTILGSVGHVTNRWTIDSIFNHREAFESEIIADCNKYLSKWFVVSQLRSNIKPPEALRTSIQNKTAAIQQAQEQHNLKEVAIQTGQKNIATARASFMVDSINAASIANAKVIEANGDAKAMKLRQAELSPLYVEYLKVTRWNGISPSTILGGGASTIVTVK